MTKMERAAEIALNLVGGPYVFAATGQTCTMALREGKMRAKPAYADKIKRYCPALSSGGSCTSCKYHGRRAFDCRGLTYWALRQAGIRISSIGSTTQWTTDSWQKKGSIDNLPRDQPIILFKQDNENPNVMAHTGFGLGDGRVVDARGHAKGILLSGVEDYPWTHFAIPFGADDPAAIEDPDELDDGETVTSTRPYLRKGAKGEDVRYMQVILIACGQSLSHYGADGSFGSETEAALIRFQRAKKLDADGICGPKTWHALEMAVAGEEEVPQEEEDLFTVTIPHLTGEQAGALLAIYEGATKEKEE